MFISVAMRSRKCNEIGLRSESTCRIKIMYISKDNVRHNLTNLGQFVKALLNSLELRYFTYNKLFLLNLNNDENQRES